MIREIKSGDTVAALLVDHSDAQEGTQPVSDPSWPLQALLIRRPQGHVFPKHAHALLERTVGKLQESIILMKGTMRVTICDRAGNDIETCDIVAGQVLFLVEGGYTIEVLENAVFYEFKNGPHVSDKILL